MDTGYLFELPNAVDPIQRGSRRLKLHAWLMIGAGTAALINACVATSLEAVKTYILIQYVNTHWITCIYLIAGVSTLLVHKVALNFYLSLSVCLNLMSVFVAGGAFIFDSFNMNVMSELSGSANAYRWLSKLPKKALVAYNVVDIVTSLFAMGVGLATLKELYKICRRSFADVEDLKRRLFLVAGLLLTLIGISKETIWVLEVRWLKSLGESARYSFLNYTMDEPVWNLIYALTGLMTIYCALTGSRLMAYCDLALLVVALYPTVHYLWVDYRWLLTVQVAEMTEATTLQPYQLLYANMGLTVVHLFLATVLIAQLVKSLSALIMPWSRVQLECDKGLRSCITCLGLSLLLMGMLYGTIDILNIRAGTFHHIFYPTDHKLPFYLIPAGCLALASVRIKRCFFYCIPLLLILLVFSMHATFFHVVTYLYLTKNEYFGPQICDLFFFNRPKCNSKVEHAGSVLHFFEAALSVGVLLVALYGSFLFGRLCTFYKLEPRNERGPTTRQEGRLVANCHRALRGACWAQIVMGLLVYVISVNVKEQGPLQEHPMFIIHNKISRTTISLMLVIFPGAQLCLSSGVHLAPMQALAIIGIALARMMDIFIQVDYRNLAYLGVVWATMTGAELVALFLQFTITCVSALLLEHGSGAYRPTELLDYADHATPTSQPIELKYSLQMDNERDNSQCLT